MKNIKKYKILVVDDDDRILRLIKNTLERSGYKVVTKADLKDIELSSFIGYDLILLDIMMPINGLEICRRIRKQIKVPIIFVTAKQLDSDLLAGINAGADDYIKKPFSIKELEARVQMHLRREERSQFHQIQHGDLLLDIDQQVLFVKNQPLSLTKREFTLVHILASQPRKIFTVEELFERLYPAESDTQFRSIAEYIYQIRSKLKVYSINPIRTQWGGGYQWNENSTSKDI
ncbi:response regulator transcription factor [Aerococcus sanguinicola]|uniref:response regulator transcription factor n=1 Tax=Aerococcus sanguinicola TaxID=119206 RepID=UPI0018A7166D|nr:response regulator transcription factor [Aerococcus sanguinicola]